MSGPVGSEHGMQSHISRRGSSSAMCQACASIASWSSGASISLWERASRPSIESRTARSNPAHLAATLPLGAFQVVVFVSMSAERKPATSSLVWFRSQR